jgi:hypothetical protein
MGLIDLKTNLKSLRYGNDQLGGGNSGQPYIKSPIPEGFNNLQLSSNDFILRGGALTARNSTLDIVRLTKMFHDPKSINGQFFIAKQNLLSRTAVRTQTSGILNEGIYTPLSTLAEAGLVGVGGHVLKQGLNPFAGSGAYSTNPNLYGVKVTNEQPPTENRLSELNRLVYIDDRGMSNFGYIRGISLNNGINVQSYDGGPGSILGVGKTNIRYASNLTIGNPNGKNYAKTIFFSNGSTLYTQKDLSGEEGAELNFGRSTDWFTPNIQDFRALLRKKLEESGQKYPETNLPWTTTTPDAPDYTTKNLESRVNIGGTNNLGPGNRQGKNLISYSKGSGIGPIDQINALPIYKRTAVDETRDKTNDLVKFRIAVINNQEPTSKTFMHFRAFIDGFTDSYNTNWSSIKYLGRGENFYTYSDFTRAISLDWTVVAQSKEELIPMYKKLNYLASSLTPDYTPKGYMAGNLVQLTVGGYLYEQVGFFTSLTYNMSESTYEIGLSTTGEDKSVKELPHMVKVTAAFTPIHDFIPSLQSITTFNTEAILKDNEGYGPQRYIALANGTGKDKNNYDNPLGLTKEQITQISNLALRF